MKKEKNKENIQSKSVIKESLKYSNSINETELYIKYNSNDTIVKVIQILSNEDDFSLRMKLKMLGDNDFCRFEFESLDQEKLLPFTIYIKVYQNKDNENNLVFEDLMPFDDSKIFKSIQIDLKKTQKEEDSSSFFFYLTLTLVSNDNNSNPNKLLGIINEGNTSYMDVIIQNMYWITYIRKQIYQMKTNPMNFVYYLQEVFNNLQTNIEPVRIDEMLNSLMPKSEWNKEKDPLEELFDILNNHISQSKICDLFSIKISSLDKRLNYLTLDCHDTLNKSIDAFINKIKTKKKNNNFFTELPKVLILKLNRFDKNNKKKDNSYLEYKQELSFASYTDKIPCNQVKYTLYSVIAHEGKKLSKGVFYSYIKMLNETKEWWRFTGTKPTKVSLKEVFQGNFGGKYNIYDFPNSKSSTNNITLIEKVNSTNAYLLIYINDYYVRDLFFEYINHEIPKSIIKRCQKEEKKEEPIDDPNDNTFQLSSIKKYIPSKYQLKNKADISFYNEINQIYMSTIASNNNNQSFNDISMNLNMSAINNINNNSQYPFNDEPLVDYSVNNDKISNDMLYYDVKTYKKYIKAPIILPLINNESSELLHELDFNNNLIDLSTSSIMFLSLCYEKLSCNNSFDNLLFKLVLLTINGHFIRMLTDLEEIGPFLQLHHQNKVILCLYKIDTTILLELNSNRKFITINYNTKNKERKYPVIFSDSKFFNTSNTEYFPELRKIVNNYQDDNINMWNNEIYIIKNFGNTIKEIIQKINVELEQINESSYDKLQQMKVVRFVIQ